MVVSNVKNATKMLKVRLSGLLDLLIIQNASNVVNVNRICLLVNSSQRIKKIVYIVKNVTMSKFCSEASKVFMTISIKNLIIKM